VIQSRSRRLLVAAVATALSAAVVYVPSAQAAAHRWTVDVGEVPVTVEAVYPTVTVPSDTNLLTITLPSEFDWTPDDFSVAPPTINWSIESAGAVVGASVEPPAPDQGMLGTFGNTGAVEFSILPTPPPVATGYTLRIHAEWDSLAPENAGDVVDLVTPFEVTSDLTVGDVAFDLRFDHATTETRTIGASLEGQPNAGDSVYLSSASAETPWTWLDGPDATNPWTSRTQVVGGLGVGATDPVNPDQPIGGPFSVSTPDSTMLVVPLPDVVYAGATTMALSVSSQDAPSSGPVVTVLVNLDMTFANGASALAASPRPAISGTAVYGHTLSVSPGTWSPVSTGNWPAGSTDIGFQWYRGAAAIVGATGPTHLLAVADVGKVLTVRATASQPGYVTTAVTTTGVTIKPAAAPRATVRPKLAGTATVGRVVSVLRGSWTPTPTSYRYQWLRNGVAIRGAVSATYRLPASMRGQLVTCRVSAFRAGYATGLSSTTVLRVH
jgi:hypothetical protein